jgi:hypothetical protein
MSEAELSTTLYTKPFTYGCECRDRGFQFMAMPLRDYVSPRRLELWRVGVWRWDYRTGFQIR